MSSYQVEVTREDGLWVADIWAPGLGPAATDTVRFADLEAEVRDLIAGLTDSEPADFELTWRYNIGGVDMTETISRLLKAEAGLQEPRRLMRKHAVRPCKNSPAPGFPRL